MGRYSERCAQAKSGVTQKTLTPKEKEEQEKKQKKDTLAKVATILRKCETLRTPDETRFLEQCSDSVKKIADRKERREIYKERVVEKEDPRAVLETKARKLADAIRRAKHLICYTGAGISTSARIPDYRGSNGIWTLLAQGKAIGQHDLSLAEPTYTHMALFELHRRQMLRFVVSQNCDGLHLRSGLPRHSLAEVHGNMYVEACKACKPAVEYWRLFDTTELTARYNHKTNRRCHRCNSPLVDTIVHFGERGSLKWPLNWAGACQQSEETDCILCLGSSLKVLKKYSWLWAMDRPVKKRPKLLVVNLQWTPKDAVAALKVNGKCDEVMRLVMQYLGIEVPAYKRERDPIFVHASMLCPEELHTVSQPMLKAKMKGEGGEEQEEEEDEDEEVNMIVEGDSSSQWAANCVAKGEGGGGEVSFKGTIIKCASDDDSNQTKVRPIVECVCGEETKTIEEKDSKVNKLFGQIKGEQSIKVEQNGDDQVIRACSSSSSSINVMDLQKRLNRFEEAFKIESNGGSQEAVNYANGSKVPSNVEIKLAGQMKGGVEVKEEPLPEDYDDLPLPSTSKRPPSTNSSSISSPAAVATEEDPQITTTNTSHTSTGLAVVRGSSSSNNCDNWTNGEEENETKLKISEAIKTLYKFETTPQLPTATSMGELHMRSLIAAGFFGNALHTAIDSPSSSTSSQHYEYLLRIYKTLESTLPHWNNPRYAYSGLHSIILPPPPELNLWGSVVIPIIQTKPEVRPPPPPPECSFCFENYTERVCQFYEPKRTEFLKGSERHGKVVVCECCDHSEEEGEEHDREDVRDGEMPSNRRRDSNELNEISNNLNRHVGDAEEETEPAEKVVKLQEDQKENGTAAPATATKVQAGWYGKGYRKYRQRRRKS